MSIDWEKEPAAIVGLTKAALEVGAASGLALTDHQVGAITSAAFAVATVLATFFVRSKVTSPATAKVQVASNARLRKQLVDVSNPPLVDLHQGESTGPESVWPDPEPPVAVQAPAKKVVPRKRAPAKRGTKASGARASGS